MATETGTLFKCDYCEQSYLEKHEIRSTSYPTVFPPPNWLRVVSRPFQPDVSPTMEEFCSKECLGMFYFKFTVQDEVKQDGDIERSQMLGGRPT